MDGMSRWLGACVIGLLTSPPFTARPLDRWTERSFAVFLPLVFAGFFIAPPYDPKVWCRGLYPAEGR